MKSPLLYRAKPNNSTTTEKENESTESMMRISHENNGVNPTLRILIYSRKRAREYTSFPVARNTDMSHENTGLYSTIQERHIYKNVVTHRFTKDMSHGVDDREMHRTIHL